MFTHTRAALAALLLSSSMILAGQAPAAAAEPKLPDLGMARLTDLRVESTFNGQRRLRFSATIVNVGTGPIELAATRASSSAAFSGVQRVYNTDGTRTDLPVPVSFVFAGDGHTHWHIRDLETYVLERLDNGVKVGTGAKSGFCFFDTTAYRLSLAGAPQSGQYGSAGCGQQSSTSLRMGVSVGWGDRYGSDLPDQFIDITNLSNGRYRLRAIADEKGLFNEVTRTNNETWVDISISRGLLFGTSVKVLGYGPTA